MIHPADFADAHRRHLEDAELLFDRERWANADHLYGLSAECGLKSVMESAEFWEEPGNPPEKYRVHVHELWPLFVDWIETSCELWYEFPDDEPFCDWSHLDRYAHRGHFQSSEVQAHRDAAERIYRMVKWHIQGFGA